MARNSSFTYGSTHSSFSEIHVKSITLVPVLTVKWPCNIDAIRYFHKWANLVEEGVEFKDINWDHTHTYGIPAINDFCLRKLAKACCRRYTEDVNRTATVIKVQLYHPLTHELVAEGEADPLDEY